MRYAGNNLSCQSCHLHAGTQAFALPMIGVYAAFPAYMARENEVRTIEDRIEGCMERSMNGRALPADGREMKAMVSYLQFLSTGLPVGTDGGRTRHAGAAVLDRAADVEKGRRGLRRDVPGRATRPTARACGKGKQGDAAGYRLSAALGTGQLQRRRRHAPPDRVGELHPRQHAVRHEYRRRRC